MLGHKTSLNKFKRQKLYQVYISNHNDIKLGINYRKKNGERTNMWRQNNILLNNQWVNEDIKEEIRKYLKTNEISQI